MLVLASVLMSLPSLLMPVQDTTPTVTSRLDCPANVFVVIVDNPGDQTFQVNVSATGQGTVASATVGPDAVVEIPVGLDGLPDPVDIEVSGDNGFPPTAFMVFPCPSRIDLRVTTPESTPVVVGLPGPCGLTTAAAHGTTEQADGLGNYLYTPDPGFVGEDSFDFECSGSGNAFGTVTVIVVAAPSPPTPAEVQPTFTG